ncbi:phage regulatory protein/antirepressor Ant [Castellaniella sp.]|uniref:phage regulatory protein/antirepressor Ant n=1 Tax=Castellaniella sp. TaxID=1955812 RepID=UPI002AFFCF10|nr:phage regulatory protein/antirepressor Ant [Castellaniella sp.]
MNALTPFTTSTTPAAHVILPATGTDQPLTMSSREIAELTGKLHKNVVRDIEAMLNGLNSEPVDFEAKYQDAKGEWRKEYRLPKRETMIIVSGYSIPLRAAIVDRWQELEEKAQSAFLNLPNFTDPVAAARAWADEAQRAIEAERQLSIAGPKADILDVLVHKEDTHSLTQAAKHFDVAPRAQFIKTLRDHKVLYPVKGGVLVPAEKYRKAGYFVVRYAMGTEGLPQQTRVTRKGMSWLASKLDRFFREAA